MGLLESIAIAVGLFLVFPKGFKYLVGTWVGTAGGIFAWSILMSSLLFSGVPISWAFLGHSFLVFVIIGCAGGVVLAAKG